MKKENQRNIALVLTFATLALYGIVKFINPLPFVLAQTTVNSAPTPTPAEFNQAEAIAKLKEQIKGKEQEPAEKVFKNIQMMKTIPAGRFLAIMEIGYARSLGVGCTHCHAPEKWESDDTNTKQIAREMAAMVTAINGQLLKNIKNLKSENPKNRLKKAFSIVISTYPYNS